MTLNVKLNALLKLTGKFPMIERAHWRVFDGGMAALVVVVVVKRRLIDNLAVLVMMLRK